MFYKHIYLAVSVLLPVGMGSLYPPIVVRFPTFIFTVKQPGARNNEYHSRVADYSDKQPEKVFNTMLAHLSVRLGSHSLVSLAACSTTLGM